MMALRLSIEHMAVSTKYISEGSCDTEDCNDAEHSALWNH